MINLDKAIEIALADNNNEMDVDRTKIIEKPYGWIKFPCPREHIETSDIMAMAIGSGDTLIRKSDGKKNSVWLCF